ncbi:MAG: alpha/beta hydrolase, partial [Pseudomonadales bacterium]|nr:alpha/beta hydrolase [Pseudomonadales bacterium]
KEVKASLVKCPVLLIDLPSQGSNKQMAADLTLEQMASLLHKFLYHHEVHKINLIGISYGSLLAAIYACHYPDNVNKLIVSGIATTLKPSSLKRLEFIRNLSEEHSEQFCVAGMNLIVNMEQNAHVNISSRHLKLLQAQIGSLDDNEKLRFFHNTLRLINHDVFSATITVPTLVVAGEFDHFTTPFEQFEFSKRCTHAHFMLMHDADHLVSLEKSEALIKASHAFLFSDIEQEKDESYTLYAADEGQSIARRISKRVAPKNPISIDVLQQDKIVGQCTVKDINFFGAALKTDTQLNAQIDHEDFQLHLKEINITLNAQYLDAMDNTTRIQFNHVCNQDMKLFKDYLNNMSV